jgi:uncharacterized membrane protein YjdF
MKLSRPILAAVIFTVLYMLAAIIAAVNTGNREFVFYIVVMFVLIALVAAVHRRVDFTAPLLWLMAIWGAMHMAGGLIPVPESWPIDGDIRVLYSWWLIPGLLKYDHVVHAYGFGTTTWLCWQGWRGSVGRIEPTAGRMILVAAAGLGFGALNEVVEFFATLMTDTNVGGYVNTGWDLVANTAGATIAALLIYKFDRPK